MLDIHLMGRTRALLLRELLVNATRPLSYNQLLKRTGCGSGCAKKIIDDLVEAGVFVETRDGQRRFLAAAKDHHLYVELRALLHKCCGADTSRANAPGIEGGLSGGESGH